MNLDQIKADLIRDEGIRLKPYRDTVGKTTIGIGRNLDDMGITESEADFLLETDIVRTIADLDGVYPWWRELSPNRQRALVNMAFNLGITRLVKFRKMMAAFRDGDYETAGHEAFQSAWAGQVGQRANRIRDLIVEG